MIALKRGTNMEDNLPRRFDHFMNIGLRIMDVSKEA